MSQDDDAVRVVRDVLGTDLVGAYLYGSAVRGGLRPHSDVDVLVVSRRRTTAQERRSLVDGLLKISGVYPRRGPDRPVELTLVVESDVRPWQYPPRCEFQYGEWLRDEFEGGATPSPAADPDLALLITMVLQSKAALVGPPPDEVLDPVPWRDVVHALTAGVPDLLDEVDTDTRNVVLTLTRIWATLVTGDLSTKELAADWALRRLPPEHHPVLERARVIYLGEQAEFWDDLRSAVRSYADHVVGEIDRAAVVRD